MNFTLNNPSTAYGPINIVRFLTSYIPATGAPGALPCYVTLNPTSNLPTVSVPVLSKQGQSYATSPVEVFAAVSTASLGGTPTPGLAFANAPGLTIVQSFILSLTTPGTTLGFSFGPSLGGTPQASFVVEWTEQSAG